LPQYDILIVSLCSPFLVGLYEDNILIKKWSVDDKISESLLPSISDIICEYKITNTIYTNGPGSHMATKLTYIVLKTLEIAKEITCKSCSGFDCNENRPIRAIGNLYFVKEKETIITKKFDELIDSGFILPDNLVSIDLDVDSKPFHLLPSV
jgi:tRNA A37 threonylcarbamoyladenosine modification protein TsaB